MPYSSGTFSRVHDFTDDRDNGIRIQASRMDAEMDGIATGLSTALLKDGTQTATAKIPFAVGLSVIDNQTILLGTNSDIAIQYDETTNDSLEISANVEGAALGIVLKSDQGDDNADQHKLSIADGGTLTLGSKISGSFVSYLTHTPNSTVASSTLAVAGNLTVGGNLTLGSGAELSEAELEMLDGITAGTVAASKAVVVDANKDIASFRNITLTGELDAGSLDVSGNVDIDGTLETDALSIASTAVTATAAELNYNDTGAAVGTVVASKTVTVDANKDVSSFRNITLTGELDAGSLDVSGDADIDGTLEADAMTLNGTAITTVATLSTGISNGNLPVFTSGVADDDFLRVNGTSIEGRSASEVLSDIGASAVAGSSSIVTTGALDSGSITSGFGAIDNGTSGIRTNTFTAETSFVPDAQDGASLGTSSLQFSDLFLADGAVTAYGDDGEVTLTHVADTGLLLSDASGVGTTKLMFGDSGTFVHQESDGTLTVESDTTLKLKGGAVLIQGANGSSMGTFSQGGTAVLSFNNSARLSAVDAGIDVVGTVAATALDISGDIDVDGTTNLDVVDIDGAVDMASTLAVTGALSAKGGAVFNEDSADVDFRVESNGNANMLFVDGGNNAVVVGQSAPDTTLSGGTPAFQVTGSGFESFASLTRRVASSSGPLLILAKSRNTAVGSHTIVQNGDVSGEIVFIADDGTDFDSRTASIKSEVDGSPSANDTPGRLVFMTSADGANSPTERMRITSAGNVGIGTSSSFEALRVAGTVKIAPGNQTGILGFGGTSNAEVAIGVFRGAPNSTSAGNSLNLAGFDNIVFSVSNTLLGSQTERMRIDSSGALCIGTSVPDGGAGDGELVVEFSSNSENAIKTRDIDSGNGGTHHQFLSGSSVVGTIKTTTSSTSYNTSSDHRLKENVTADWDATTRLKKLKPCRFNFISDETNTLVDGFLAHEAQAVVPECVTGTHNEVDADGKAVMQGIDQSKLVPLLVKTIQELEARITALEGA